MLHVSLLGEQTIVDDRSGRARRPSSRALALVAFLVWHAGSFQPRQLIAGLFWPDSTDAQALTNLRRELHHLRQALGDGSALVVGPRELGWRDVDTCRVDVRVFGTQRAQALAAAARGDDDAVLAHATNAVAQYRGDFLPGVYDDWLLEARAELQRQCADLCDLLCSTLTRSGDLNAAVEAARRRVQLQPLEEVGYCTLMRLQAELGDRSGAVSSYHHCASVLERELGVVPAPATQEVFRRLMASEPTDTPSASTRVPPARSELVARSGPATAQLIGRDRELAELADLWRGAAAGRPSLAVVRGAAGVGKTRLVAEIAELARLEGALVAGSQCFGAAGRLALAPVADWLRNPVLQAATAGLDQPWRAEVARLVPPAGRLGSRASSRALVDAWQRHRFFEGLARALLCVGRPLLLVLDNLQWCDQETLEFLPFALGLVPQAQVMVAATLRDDHSEHDRALAEWVGVMRATGTLTELPLSPLEVTDTARLAGAVSGRPLAAADADLLQVATAGFPLYVIEALRGSVDLQRTQQPLGDVSQVLRKRLEQAGAAARDVAGLAAAVGTNFTLDLLTEASDLEADVVVAAVDELWRRRIVHELGDGYDFSHDLLRDAAYALLSPPRRWLLHRRIAQGLELIHAEDTDAVAAQLAGQYARGGRPARALAYYRRAADVAAGLFAHADAIRLHEEALAVVRGLPAGRERDRHELAVLEAMAAPLNARYGYASLRLQHALERSITLATALRRKDSTLSAMAALWASRFVQGRTADSYRTARDALGLIDPQSDFSGPAHFAVGGSAVSLGMPEEGLRHLELAAGLSSGAVSLSIGTRPDVHGTAFAAHAHWMLGHDEQALAACRRAIALAREIDHPYSLAVALAYGCITLQMLGDVAEMSRTVDELHALCQRYGFAYYREWALILRAWAGSDGSEGSEGSDEDLARRGIANLKAEGAFARMPYWLCLLADISLRSGRPDAARASLDAAIVAAQARDDLWWLPEVMRKRAAWDPPEAAALRLKEAAALAAAHGSGGLLRRCERDLALAEEPASVAVLHKD